MILILLLLLVAGAFGYDRKVAGPACEAGQKKILELLAQQQAQPGKVTASFAEVQKTLGKKPSSRIDKEYYSIETYSWMRGSLFQTYFIRVIYRKDRDGALAVDGVTAPNEEPSESQLPGPIKPRELTEEEKAGFKPPPGPPGGPTSEPPGVMPPGAPPGPPGAGGQPPAEPAGEPADKPEKPDQPAADKTESEAPKTARPRTRR